MRAQAAHAMREDLMKQPLAAPGRPRKRLVNVDPVGGELELQARVDRDRRCRGKENVADERFAGKGAEAKVRRALDAAQELLRNPAGAIGTEAAELRPIHCSDLHIGIGGTGSGLLTSGPIQGQAFVHLATQQRAHYPPEPTGCH